MRKLRPGVNSGRQGALTHFTQIPAAAGMEEVIRLASKPIHACQYFSTHFVTALLLLLNRYFPIDVKNG